MRRRPTASTTPPVGAGNQSGPCGSKPAVNLTRQHIGCCLTQHCAPVLLLLACVGCAFAQDVPEGANDPGCRPSLERPHPVVLVHGTSSNMAHNWSVLAPMLRREGYCVYALNYGATANSGGRMYGLAPIAQSARELGRFVERVLANSGAARVDIVGHSQGGVMPRHYLRFLGGAAKVRKLIGIAPVNHGTTSLGLSAYSEAYPGLAELLLGAWCGACADLLRGSAFMHRLNADGDTVDGVEYTVIASRYDDVVTPYDSQFLDGPGVRNVLIQDHCPAHRVLHEALAFDPPTLRLVLNALDPRSATPPRCAPSSPAEPTAGIGPGAHRGPDPRPPGTGSVRGDVVAREAGAGLG